MSALPGLGFLGLLGIHPVRAAAGGVINAVVSWVLGGTASAIREVAHAISVTTTPQLTSTWFSSYYWRVAGLATLLTVPFLFAAALQAMIHSDLALLARAAFGYLPLALIGVGIASPITMLLLSATDEMSAAVSGLAAGGGTHFLLQSAAATVTRLNGAFVLFAALIMVAAALTLAIELIAREAAVYIVVLMLPLAFAALVWPARRVWVVRIVELLVALIVSKFVIVAVLSLAGAAFGQSGTTGISRLLLSMSLLLLAAFSPWTMLRLMPFTELAASAAGMLSQEVRGHTVARASRAARGARGVREALLDADDAALPPAAVAADMAATTVTTRVRAETPADWDLGSRGESGLLAAASDSGSGSGEGDVSPGADAEPADDTPKPKPGERLPGMDAIWQAENKAWPDTRLGPDGWGGPTEYIPQPAEDDEPDAPEPANP